MKQNESFSNSESPEVAPDKETIQEIDFSMRSMVRGFLQDADKETNKKHLVIESIASFGKEIFVGREELLEAILKRFEAIQYDTDIQFTEDITKETLGAMVEYCSKNDLPLKKLLADFRIRRIEQSGDIPLDKSGILYASRYGNSIELHINKGLTADVWKEAMSIFVPIIQGDKNIKTIDMRSWVIAKKLDYFKRLGFTVKEITNEKILAEIRAGYTGGLREHLNDPIGEAHMTRDEFLDSRIAKQV